MKKSLLFLAIPLLYSGISYAQFRITVINVQNNEPLVGASIRENGSEKVFITDSEGRADLTGNVTSYLVSYVGFRNKKIINPRPNETVYLEPDFQVLREVEVKGHENNSDYLSVAGSYNYIGKKSIDNYSHESLVRAFNTVPGVRMEERSPSSYRVSIRGSLLRAPFGVRNVKVYWNDIPFTDPTGNAYLYFLDNENIDQIEVIKGPAGSVYGAGMGGVLLLSDKPLSENGLHASLGMSAGSFGLKSLDLGVHFGDEMVQSSLQYSGLTSDGYRDHTQSDRNVIQWQSVIRNSESNKLSVNILYSGLFYELPGGLTRDEYEENPRQARQISVDQKASVDHENILVGLNNHHRWNNWTNSTSLYFSNGTKENPFNTNYELERLKGLGGRTKFTKESELWGNPLYQTAGLEGQFGKFHASNHDNDGGYAGALRYEDETEILQGFVFAQAEYFTSTDWIVTIGASLNYLKYDIHRLRDAALDSSFAFSREFQPIVSPRIGVVRRLTQNSSVHASISEGFSPPTQDEIRTSDGEINRDLEAERGFNYEIGYRGNTSDGKLVYDITAFYMQQKETIVSRTSEGGISKFENAGSTSQRGVEALLALMLVDQTSSFISQLKLQTAITYHNFEFQNYIKNVNDENVDYSGNDLTGTAPFIAVTSLSTEFNFGGYIFLSHNFTDEIPLNDANTVYATSYHLVTGKIGWRNEGRTRVDIFAGVDNLLDEKYSLGNDLNAFGERYYEPSPTRNYYFGINIFL